MFRGCGSHAEPVPRGELGGGGDGVHRRRAGGRGQRGLGSRDTGLGTRSPRDPVHDPRGRSETFGNLALVAGGRGERTRDPAQPVRVLLTWLRGPDAFPHPQRLGKGGAGGDAPSPNAASASGGVDTPDSVLPPGRAEGDFEAPPRGFWTQVLCGPAASSRPRPRDPSLPALAVARPACPGRSAAAPSLRALDPAGPGGGETGARTPFGLPRSRESPSHSAANWLGDMAGCPFALARCGTPLPGGGRLGNGVCDVTPERTNRSSSREEAARPPSLCFLTRVSERARAEGAGAIASRVARMSGEAPPLRLYIKRWRGARRRHFALEWSSV